MLNKSKKGFTLLEALFAIFIITVGLTGAISAILQLLNLSSFSSSKLTAAYLAQEGIEIVRNMRDTNWLQAGEPGKVSPWDDGLPTGDYELDYTTVTFSNTTDFEKCADLGYNCNSYNNNYLRIDGGFYNYTNGAPTKFKRKITIQKPTADRLDITVQITWSEKGKSYSFSAQENLYNWR